MEQTDAVPQGDDVEAVIQETISKEVIKNHRKIKQGELVFG